MKILIVAHPDDEAIWFPMEYFDQIIIVFLGRKDRPDIAKKRRLALSQHPLRDRINILGINESGYWKNRFYFIKHFINRLKLRRFFLQLKKKHQILEIFTHNPEGEYGHSDHILIYEEVLKAFPPGSNTHLWGLLGTKINDRDIVRTLYRDLKLFQQVKVIYETFGCWTWKSEYNPSSYERYFLMNSCRQVNHV